MAKAMFKILTNEEILTRLDEEEAGFHEDSMLEKFPVVLVMTADFAQGLGSIIRRAPVGVGNNASYTVACQLMTKAIQMLNPEEMQC